MIPSTARTLVRLLAVGAVALLTLPTIATAKAPASAKLFNHGDIKKCAKPTATLKIGNITELTGVLAIPSTAEGVAMAISEITNGGTGGFLVGATCYGIDVVVRDDRSDPATAVSATREIVNDMGIKFLLGPNNGSMLASSYPITQALSPKPVHIAVSVVLEQRGVLGQPDTIGLFRAFTPGTIVVDGVLAAVKKFYPKAKSLYFLWPDDTSTQYFVDNGFKKKFPSRGFTIQDDRFPTTTTDFTSYLLRVKAANPDVFVVGYIPALMNTIIKQSTQLGLTVPLLTFNGTPAMALGEATGSPLTVPVLNTAFVPDLVAPPTPALKAFVQRYVKFTGHPVQATSFSAVTYYEPTFMLIKAIQVAGTTTDTAKVGQTLLKLRMNSTEGPYCWNPGHIAIIPVTFTLIKDAKQTSFLWNPSAKLCTKPQG